MFYRVFTLLLAVGVVTAFAVPTRNLISPTSEAAAADSQNKVVEDTSSLAKAIDNSKYSTEVSRGKMKSNSVRWFVRGIIAELWHNVFIRQFNRLRGTTIQNDQRCRQHPKNEIAIVTGATGGIGLNMAHELADRGYDVVIAVRDVTRGKQLVEEIKGRLAETPICKIDSSKDSNSLPIISVVEYHADIPQSALDVASSVKELAQSNNAENARRVSLLINNAGIMGKSKQLTMKVNLIGPALLTLALLPLMSRESSEGAYNNENTGTCTSPSANVINVGSSAHLRATHVIDEDITLGEGESYITAMSNGKDKDLSTYAQSKLALMQFSTLLRHSFTKIDAIKIYDAHPGLVWTPLLRNHIGEGVTNFLRKSGLAKLIYKTPVEGARAIVSALDYEAKASASGSDDQEGNQQQVYFENGKPGGYATPESRQYAEALKLWRHVIAPEVKGVMSLPKELSYDLKIE